MNFRHFLPALLIFLASAFSVEAQSTATISGEIVDSVTGRPVSGAIIIATKTTAPIAKAAATSTFDGGFQIPSLAAGVYDRCVQFPAGGYLNTCHWGISATSLTLASGQKSTENTLRVTPGSILKIHIDDGPQLLSQKTRDGNAPDLVMGVWNSGIFYAARQVNKTPTAADYQLTVPFDANLTFSIHSRNLVLGDSNKKPLAGSADEQPFQHAANVPAPAGFSYSILSALP